MIYISGSKSLLYAETNDLLMYKSYIRRIKTPGSYFLKVYQFLRPDGWCLEVIIYMTEGERVRSEPSKICFKILDPEEYIVEKEKEEKIQS
uniref:Uncharacterized protein n=1 Tax=Acrobeloides nanus TaxID=290746 RepID=A0A914D3L1_9BILA